MQQKTPIARLRSYLTEQSHTLRQLLHIGTPIILGQLGIIAVNFADTMMVGKYNTDDLAAASFVNNIFALFFVLGLGFSYGLTPTEPPYRYWTYALAHRRVHLATALQTSS